MSQSKQDPGQGRKNTPGLFSLLKPYAIIVFIMIIMALLGSGINLLIPKIIAAGIDDYSAGSYSFSRVLTEFIAASLAIFIFTFLQSVVQTYVSEKVARDLRTRLADRISRQSYLFVMGSNPSKLLTNLTSDIDSVKMFVSQAFVTIISSLFVIAGASALLFSINWKLAATVVTMVPVIAVAFYIVFSKVKVLFKRSREIIDMLNRTINESITGSALIRVLNAQQPEGLKFLEANILSRDNSLSIVRLFSTLVPIIMLVSNMAVVAILMQGGHYVVNGTMSLGNFAAFNSYLVMLIFPILMIGFMSNIIASATASYVRIGQVLDAPLPEEKGSIETGISGNITLRKVNLAYGGKPVLKDISFNIRAGSKTAIIGPTAAGKSQLLYLLSGLMPPDSGSIEFDGRPVSEYTRKEFHRMTGFVFQDSVIFNMSLRENIAFNEIVTEESMKRAIETAELTDFIDSLPGKLETVVSERGSSLSGGQKQRIMLARALAINPKILLLDDFTSRVDRKTENKILCNLENNYPGMTLISVTQRIAPVKHFEQIILLMEGEIIASGRHRELKETSPEYIQIYNSQRSTHHYEL
ncbi:MAG: ABC transporter ATP-binding protein/permease [Bacteroidales bacterium]|jgi:ATP-binding cassette subfamily B protein|nr:ABC transporter ATP-binding protein/permease [Bacteroidales bacterium]